MSGLERWVVFGIAAWVIFWALFLSSRSHWRVGNTVVRPSWLVPLLVAVAVVGFVWRWDSSVDRPRRNPSRAPRHVTRGIDLLRRGDLDAAIVQFDRAIALAPDNFRAYYYRAEARGRQGSFDQALADLAKAQTLAPGDATVHRLFGWIYARQESYAAAVGSLDRAIALDPADAWSYVSRGRAHARLGHTDLARADFQRGCQLGDATACSRYRDLGGQ